MTDDKNKKWQKALLRKQKELIATFIKNKKYPN